MKNIERHPAPENILRQITAETINGLELGTQTNDPGIAKMEAALGLIAKAWGLPHEVLQKDLDLIQRQKQYILSGRTGEALPANESPYSGPMIVELLWGLFETAVKLENAQDRTAIYDLALAMADLLSLDDRIKASGPTEGQN